MITDLTPPNTSSPRSHPVPRFLGQQLPRKPAPRNSPAHHAHTQLATRRVHSHRQQPSALEVFFGKSPTGGCELLAPCFTASAPTSPFNPRFTSPPTIPKAPSPHAPTFLRHLRNIFFRSSPKKTVRTLAPLLPAAHLPPRAPCAHLGNRKTPDIHRSAMTGHTNDFAEITAECRENQAPRVSGQHTCLLSPRCTP